MGRNVYISFLGARKYELTRYVWGTREALPTTYVQAAELSLLVDTKFDAIHILATKKAEDVNLAGLQDSLRADDRGRVIVKRIGEDMSEEGQWTWFETLLDIVQPGDVLTIDLTHGFRSMPLVAATALNFLRKARCVRIDHLFYGAFEASGGAKLGAEASEIRETPIIELAGFLAVDEWADAVAALADNIDARKLADIARNAPSFHARVLQNKELLDALEHLSGHLHNVEVNKVREAARAAIEEIARANDEAHSPVERVLVEILLNKVRDLAGHDQLSHHYDRDYFDNQLEIAKTLFAHGLYMQGFTVLREFIASIGMIRETCEVGSGDDGEQRYRAELFIRIVQFSRFKPQNESDRKRYMEVKPLADEIDKCGAMRVLRESIKTLVDIRNGFDHAWTRVSSKDLNAVAQAEQVTACCRKALDMIDQANLLGPSGSASVKAAAQ